MEIERPPNYVCFGIVSIYEQLDQDSAENKLSDQAPAIWQGLKDKWEGEEEAQRQGQQDWYSEPDDLKI